MAELDLFEARFAAAYRRYLDEVPTEVDAAAMAHAVVAAPHRSRWAAWAGSLRAAPAFAWLVLVALLLAALGAALYVGAQREQGPPAVVPPAMAPAVVPAVGPVFTCPPGSTPDRPGPADQARPSDFWLSWAVDRTAGRLVAAPGETWAFDLCTNTWSRLHPDRESPPGGWLVYDADSDVTIAAEYGRLWAYDAGTNTWSEKASAARLEEYGISLMLYDPVTGLVVALNRDGDMWNYDVETDTWTPIRQTNRPTIESGASAFAYDASVDRLIAYAPHEYSGTSAEEYWNSYETWLFDIRTGTWSRSGVVPPKVNRVGVMNPWAPAIVHDEAAERTIVIGSGRMAAYNARADRWEILLEVQEVEVGWLTTIPGRPERFPFWMVYDPVNGRLVGPGELPMAGPDGPEVWANDMLAFDTSTREWTVLLEPMQVRPSPTPD